MSQLIKTKSALLAHVMKASFVKEYVATVSKQERPLNENPLERPIDRE